MKHSGKPTDTAIGISSPDNSSKKSDVKSTSSSPSISHPIGIDLEPMTMVLTIHRPSAGSLMTKMETHTCTGSSSEPSFALTNLPKSLTNTRIHNRFIQSWQDMIVGLTRECSEMMLSLPPLLKNSKDMESSLKKPSSTASKEQPSSEATLLGRAGLMADQDSLSST